MNLDAEALPHNSERIWRELLGATPFRPEDVKDPFGLVVKFWTPDGASAHLREKFSWTTLRLLREFDGVPPAPEQLVSAVLGEFNLLMEGPCLYDERLFGTTELTDEAGRLLKGTTEDVEKARLNRLLLEALYWPAVARSRGYAHNFALLVRQAGLLLVGKVLRGEIGAETHFTPADVAKEAIARLADGRAIWKPEKSKLITFAFHVMRSYVDHELNKKSNTAVESLSRPLRPRGDDDGSASEGETRFSDSGGGGRSCAGEAEFADIMEKFPEDSLERNLLGLIRQGKGDEKLPELAAALHVGVKEVKTAKDNIGQVLIQLNYFKGRSR